MKIERWLIYTVCVAALPFLIRLMCYLILNNPVGSAVSPIDIVFFGLTLNIAGGMGCVFGGYALDTYNEELKKEFVIGIV